MNVPLIEMPYDKAAEKFREYHEAVRRHRRREDEELLRGFRELKQGRKLIDVHAAMKFAGLNARNQPKLAICRADATHCWFRGGNDGTGPTNDGSGVFRMYQDDWGKRHFTRQRIKFPADTFARAALNERLTSRAVVPSIPPRLRPQIAYSKLHILWEAEWETVPRDPLLLRRIGGFIFVVLAHWDLTDLESAVLKRSL